MVGLLLDANVLIAMAWPSHTFHARVQHWFSANARHGWATCPLTESAFVRIISNPAFSPHALDPKTAVGLLAANMSHASHLFWPDDLPFGEAVRKIEPLISGRQQVTDAYLLGLAIRRKAKLATLDVGLQNVFKQFAGNIELIH